MHFNIRATLRVLIFLQVLGSSSLLWSTTNVLGERLTVIENISDCKRDGYAEIDSKICLKDNLQTLEPTDFIKKDEAGKVELTQYIEEAPQSIWLRIKKRYDLNTPPSKSAAKSIKKYEDWYKARPEYVDRMINRSEKYLYYVVEQVELRGMPSEIALLPMIESAYNPIANSRMKANGMWQFIPSTGRLYGLKQDWWRDDRRNFIESTNAALNYLEKLYGDFGSWELALAAYNAGEGRVGRAIKKNKIRKKPTDYYNLTLPRETKNYVPKLLAIKNIMSSPEKYGLNIKDIVNSPYFASVPIPQEIDTELIAEFAEIPMEEFQLLNAQHKRPLMKSSDDFHEVLLPIYSVENFYRNMSIYNKPLVSWQSYEPKSGEKIHHVAKRFGIDTKYLAQINHLSTRKTFRKNSIILIPSGEAMKTKFPLSKDSLLNFSSIITHHISPGESLSQIADEYKISVKDLMEFNELKSSKIISGSTLDIPK